MAVKARLGQPPTRENVDRLATEIYPSWSKIVRFDRQTLRDMMLTACELLEPAEQITDNRVSGAQWCGSTPQPADERGGGESTSGFQQAGEYFIGCVGGVGTGEAVANILGGVLDLTGIPEASGAVSGCALGVTAVYFKKGDGVDAAFPASGG